jgi:hypothetical protein
MIVAENQTMPTYFMHERNQTIQQIDGVYINLEEDTSEVVIKFLTSYFTFFIFFGNLVLIVFLFIDFIWCIIFSLFYI